MQKKITKRKFKQMVDTLQLVDFKEKDLFTIRAEKLGKKAAELAEDINSSIADKRAEFASTDEKGRLILEEITITDKSGTSRKEKTGNYSYTSANDKLLKAAIEKIWDEEIDIPVNIIDRENNEALYKRIFQTYSASFITIFAGILLDVPLDADGFVDEEFALKYSVAEKK